MARDKSHGWVAAHNAALRERRKHAVEITDANDPRRYLDLEKKSAPHEVYPALTQECPSCQGHGYYNLTIHAYGFGQHFKRMCGACWSWGYIEPGACAHVWDGPSRNIGRCLHEWSCSKCGMTREVDSSD